MLSLLHSFIGISKQRIIMIEQISVLPEGKLFLVVNSNLEL